MELESDMVSTKKRYHKNEENLTRQMENNHFLPLLSSTDGSLQLPIILCTDYGTKFLEVSHKFKLYSSKICCIFYNISKTNAEENSIRCFFP